MPGDANFAADDSVSYLEYVNDAGDTVKEQWRAERGDYGRVYDALYQTLTNGTPNFVKETEALTNMELLERAFEQPAPATISLAK